MTKKKKEKNSGFFCKECGYEAVNYLGKCPSCQSWNSFIEAPAYTTPSNSLNKINNININKNIINTARRLIDIELNEAGERLDTGFEEFNRVLGGGLQQGSVILLGGDPGIGKSTLLMQVLGKIAAQQHEVLYVSGEESYNQVKQRALRLKVSQNILFLAETVLENIIESISTAHPKLLIIDSIQTIASSQVDALAGSPSQIKYSANHLVQIAKQHNITIILIGHITKDGAIAGPKILEHMVDVVLQFEGDKQNFYRMLRGQKNRFGPTDELGIFEMKEFGLEEVKDPNALFISHHEGGLPTGTVLTATLHGSRVILAEVQALVGYTAYAQPRRIVNGLDFNRVNQICAVLERRLGYSFAKQDIYTNIVGGLSIEEPAGDLAVAIAIMSCAKDIPIREKFIMLGELSLTGEIRQIPSIETRIKEIYRHGIRHIICPKSSSLITDAIKQQQPQYKDIHIYTAAKLQDAIKIAFGN